MTVFLLDSYSWSSIKLPVSITRRAGHSLLSLTGPQAATSSAEEQEEKENTPNRYTKTPTQKLLVFAGGDNDGTFFNDSIRISLKKDDY